MDENVKFIAFHCDDDVDTSICVQIAPKIFFENSSKYSRLACVLLSWHISSACHLTVALSLSLVCKIWNFLSDFVTFTVKVKVKLSLFRPGQAHMDPGS